MNKMLSIALLVGGILLLGFGLNASDSLTSELSRVFTGKPTDEAMWMLVGGAVAVVVGIVGLLSKSR